jgi:hypothetical protein
MTSEYGEKERAMRRILERERAIRRVLIFGIIFSLLMRCPKYRKLYKDEVKKLRQRFPDRSELHIHAMARYKIIKIFLMHWFSSRKALY